MSKHRKIEELSYFNAIACLLVVLTHVLSQSVSSLDPGSWQLAAVYFPHRLSAFVVPAFLFSGAVKMSVQMDKALDLRGYFRYFWSRVKKIYIPYVIWNVIYYVEFLRIGFVRGSAEEFFSYLLVGNLSSPFYYVITVMQFYALQPLWRWIVKNVPWYTAGGCGMLITFASMQLGTILDRFGISFPYSDRIFPTYLIFWVVGLYVGQNYDAFVRSLTENKVGHWLGGLFVLVYCGIAYLQHARGIYLFDLNYSKVIVDCLSIFLLLRLSVAIVRGPAPLRKGLSFVHAASFFVYLSHCLFLTLGANYFSGQGITEMSRLLVLRALVTYGCSFGLYGIWYFLRTKIGTGRRKSQI